MFSYKNSAEAIVRDYMNTETLDFDLTDDNILIQSGLCALKEIVAYHTSTHIISLEHLLSP